MLSQWIEVLPSLPNRSKLRSVLTRPERGRNERAQPQARLACAEDPVAVTAAAGIVESTSRAVDRNLRGPQRRAPVRVHALEVVDAVQHHLPVDLDACLVGIGRLRILGARADRDHRRAPLRRARGGGGRRHGRLLLVGFEHLDAAFQVVDRLQCLIEHLLELLVGLRLHAAAQRQRGQGQSQQSPHVVSCSSAQTRDSFARMLPQVAGRRNTGIAPD